MKKIKRPEDSALHKIIKVLMTAVFAWSGIFWGGVTALQFSVNNKEHINLASEFLAGVLVLLLCLILCWFRLYFIQIIPCVIGIVAYLNPAREMIDHARDTGVIFKPTFEQRYLPMVLFAILGLALFLLRALAAFNAKAKRDEQYNNQPSESILDKHHDE